MYVRLPEMEDGLNVLQTQILSSLVQTRNLLSQIAQRKEENQVQSKTKLNKIVGTTALYCRLSRDDGAEVESNSIAN